MCVVAHTSVSNKLGRKIGNKMKPYTYLIGWPDQDTWYYGVRYAKGCDPTDLWNPYTTSSNHVKQFVQQHGAPPVRTIRKVFENTSSARRWEERVLKRMRVVEDSKWLNKTDNKSITPQYGTDHPHYGKTGTAHHSYGKPNTGASNAQKQKWANFSGQHHWSNPEFIARRVADHSGENHHMKRLDVVQKVSGKNNWIYQKPGALEERRQKFIEMNKARKGTHYKRLQCQYCSKDYSSVQIKQHEKKCLTNLTSSVGNTDKAVYNNLVGII